MSYELKSYQETAVYDEADGLLANTLRFLKSPKHQRLFVLKSIMGSGKTIIASEYIKAILSSTDTARTDKELCIIWLSKGNAGLHMQSSEKLEQAIDDRNIHIYGIRDSADFVADRFYDKDVYVINWEKINNLKDGELVNNLFVESEMKNLRSAKRKSPGVEFIFIIDEFHTNYDTPSYNEIVKFFDPHVIVGMSATPSNEQMAKADVRYSIPVADVMAEGMVKKGVCFNTATDYTDDEISQYDTIDEFFLKLSLRQRDLLEQKYRTEGSDVIPLLLIQFNDDKTNEDIIKVKDLLDKEYENNKHGTYAIWISETDNKKDKLRSSDDIIQNLDRNDVRVLLFKQAVATGWDCPRAHVLLRYRRVATRKDANAVSSFDVQTLGRIFRMPEPNRFANKTYKHYFDDDLNYGYVYVPNNSYTLEKEFNQAFGAEAGIFNQSFITVDFSAPTPLASDNLPEIEPDYSDLLQTPLTIRKPVEVPEKSIQELIEIGEGECQVIDETPLGRPSIPIAPVPLAVPTVPADNKDPGINYAAVYGEKIRKTEEILSVVNVIAEDAKPDAVDINRVAKDIMKNVTKQLSLNISDDAAGQITFKSGVMEISDGLFDGETVSVITDTGSSFSISDTPTILADKAKKMLSELIDRKAYPKATKEYLKKQINRFFRKSVGGFDELNENASAETSKLILSNEGMIKKLIRELDDAIRQMSAYEFNPAPFKFPTSFRYPPNAVETSKGLMHFPLPSTASGPELIFERILNNPDNNVLLWYKNADHGANAFCIPYIIRNQLRGRTIEVEMPTYPDFIVIFKDGSVGIYETKDYDKKDDNDTPKALQISMTIATLLSKGYKAKGGLIYIDQQTEQIHDADKYLELK